jgi:hypothetical protein
VHVAEAESDQRCAVSSSRCWQPPPPVQAVAAAPTLFLPAGEAPCRPAIQAKATAAGAPLSSAQLRLAPQSAVPLPPSTCAALACQHSRSVPCRGRRRFWAAMQFRTSVAMGHAAHASRAARESALCHFFFFEF